MQIARQPRRTKGVSLTPLIDVVFLLIVFFMLSTSFVMSESLELSMPELANATPATPKKPLTLIIRGDNEIQVGNKLLSHSQLDNALFNILGRDPMTSILILSTPTITVQELVSVMDMVYLGGGRNVQIDALNVRQ